MQDKFHLIRTNFDFLNKNKRGSSIELSYPKKEYEIALHSLSYRNSLGMRKYKWEIKQRIRIVMSLLVKGIYKFSILLLFLFNLIILVQF